MHILSGTAAPGPQKYAKTQTFGLFLGGLAILFTYLWGPGHGFLCEYVEDLFRMALSCDTAAGSGDALRVYEVATYGDPEGPDTSLLVMQDL